MASRNRYTSANNQGGHDGRQHGGGWRAAGHTEACSWRCTKVHLPEKKDNELRIPHPNSSQYVSGVSRMRPPTVLGCSSVGTEKNWSPGLSQLRFIDKQYLQEDGTIDVELDLNKGFKEPKLKHVGFNSWNYEFYHWILNNIDKLKAPNTSPPRLAADFVCRKQPVEWIMHATCNLKRIFTIEAHLFRGSIFLQAGEFIRDEDPEDLLTSNEDTEKDVEHTDDTKDSSEDSDNDTRETTIKEELTMKRKILIYAHKFFDYMTGGNLEIGDDQNVMFVCMLELKVAGMSVIYPIKVHCADQHQFREDFEDLDAFIIIRSICKDSSNSESSQAWYKRYHLQRFWTEGQMTGIPRTVVGFRNDAGMVHTVHNITNDNIPNMAQGAWRPEASVNFLADFLHYIKRKVEEQPDKYHRFIRDSGRVIRHMTATKEMIHHALPEGFLDELATKLDEGND